MALWKYDKKKPMPIMPIKTPKRQNRPSEIRLLGVLPYNAYKTPDTKKQANLKKMSIDPHKYVYQGSPLVLPLCGHSQPCRWTGLLISDG